MMHHAEVPTLRAPRTLCVDAHHHLWQFNTAEFGWIDDSMGLLRKDFLFTDLKPAVDSAGIDVAIAVQAHQSLEETRWLLQQATDEPRIAGIVGWAPIGESNFEKALEELKPESKLVGLRHIVQAEAAGFLDGEAFNAGMRLLTHADLAYDILIQAHQLPEAMRFVDRHPNQRFVIDHCAKPKVATNEIEPWKQQITEIAKRQNVFCKVSGLATEADWGAWTLEALRRYLDVVLDAFGPDRVMAASDWPVCLLATSYSHWWQSLREYASSLSQQEQAAIFGLVARDFYRLKLPIQEAA